MQNIKRSALLVTVTAGILVGGAGAAMASSDAAGAANNSPGVLSGNLIQVPVHVPVNVCGDSVDVIGLLNPAFGNHCVNNG
ncbi:chaplin [Streptacidiphilus albus]|uniref:chaplin n=1 Tax=Streptacidiphilus albus TaxID=105425 RepID=UPI00054BFC20|nr:chaplin [Streptacidiphilus albus]